MAADNEEGSMGASIVKILLGFAFLFLIYKFYLNRKNPAEDAANDKKHEVIQPVIQPLVTMSEYSIEHDLAGNAFEFSKVMSFADALDYISDPNIDADNGVTIPIALAKSIYSRPLSKAWDADSMKYITSMLKIISRCDLGKRDTLLRTALIWNTIVGINSTRSFIKDDSLAETFFDPHLWLEKKLVKLSPINLPDRSGRTALNYALSLSATAHINGKIAKEYCDILRDAGGIANHGKVQRE